jgi:hypothetical protein
LYDHGRYIIPTWYGTASCLSLVKSGSLPRILGRGSPGAVNIEDNRPRRALRLLRLSDIQPQRPRQRFHSPDRSSVLGGISRGLPGFSRPHCGEVVAIHLSVVAGTLIVPNGGRSDQLASDLNWPVCGGICDRLYRAWHAGLLLHIRRIALTAAAPSDPRKASINGWRKFS